jgi:predicted restriction endonuclease
MKKDENIEEIVRNSFTYQEVMTKLGYRCKGGGVFRSLKKRLVKLNIDTSHFKGKSHGTSKTAKKTLDIILVENSDYMNLYSLKKRIVKENMLEYKCELCGINNWLGKQLTLHLDHKNGNNRDHRIENIRFLCPNCHSQTDNYAGRNNK